MKKTNFLFTLFLCLTLLVSFASAETAAYVRAKPPVPCLPMPLTPG